MNLKNRIFLGGLICLSLICLSLVCSEVANADAHSENDTECVILLHGLARTAASMSDLQQALSDAGYAVANIDYPSRKNPIEALSGPAIEKGLALCAKQDARIINFVTHSMGGILFRHYLTENSEVQFGRTVMLGPPNKGSEAVDGLKEVPGFMFLNGPAGLQMGTDEHSVPIKLGAVNSDVAIIAGTFSINWVLSTYLPDPDDGKVSVESTRLEGMCAHLQVDVSHPFIMKDEGVISEVISYLQTGKFVSTTAEYPDCAFR